MTADRGLCGGFNSNINRATVKYVKSLEDQGKAVKLITIGKKSRDFLTRLMKDKILESFTDFGVLEQDIILPFKFLKKFKICIVLINLMCVF